MELYSAKIQLGGSRENEVRRVGLTAAEVYILKHIHGSEFVSEIKIAGDVKRSQREERIRLLGEGETPGIYSVENVRKVFPSDMTQLPESLPGEMIDVASMEKDVVKAPEAVKAVEDMSADEIEAELKLTDQRRGYLAKARKAKADKAAADATAGQASTLD